jgi:hypothetical protein
LENLDLRHDAIGEQRRRRQVRHLLERVHDLECLVDPGAALRALARVGAKRGDAEADVAVHEQIDFVGK